MFFIQKDSNRFGGTFGNANDPADFFIEKDGDKVIFTIGDKVIEGNCPKRISDDKELKSYLLNPEVVRMGLSGNVDVNEQISVEHDCTLDLNGNTITFVNSKSNVPISCDKGTMVVENGVLDATSAKPSLVPISGWGGKLILNNVTVLSNSAEESCVFCNAGEVIINSGTYINMCDSTYEYAGGAPLVLNVKNDSDAKITCYGGFFVGRDPALGDDKNGGTFVAEGYESVPTYMNGYQGYLVRKK